MRRALASLPGVASIDTDVSKMTVTVTVKDDKFNAEDAIAALVGVGFGEGKVIESSGETKSE